MIPKFKSPIWVFTLRSQVTSLTSPFQYLMGSSNFTAKTEFFHMLPDQSVSSKWHIIHPVIQAHNIGIIIDSCFSLFSYKHPLINLMGFPPEHVPKPWHFSPSQSLLILSESPSSLTWNTGLLIPYSSILFQPYILHQTDGGIMKSRNQKVSFSCLNSPVYCSYNKIQTFPCKAHLTSHPPTSVLQLLSFSPACTALWPCWPSFCSLNIWNSSPHFQRLVPLPKIS